MPMQAPLPPTTGKMVKSAAKCLRAARAASLDNLRPRHAEHLSDEALEAFAKIFNFFEKRYLAALLGVRRGSRRPRTQALEVRLLRGFPLAIPPRAVGANNAYSLEVVEQCAGSRFERERNVHPELGVHASSPQDCGEIEICRRRLARQRGEGVYPLLVLDCWVLRMRLRYLRRVVCGGPGFLSALLCTKRDGSHEPLLPWPRLIARDLQLAWKTAKEFGMGLPDPDLEPEA